MLTIVCCGDLWVNMVSAFYNNWTLKINVDHRYNCTDSALMG